MATRAVIRAQVLKCCGDNTAITAADVNTMLTSDNLEIQDAFSWTWRQSWTKMNLLAPQTITISATVGSSVVLSAQFTAAMADQYIRIGGEPDWYRLITVVPGVSGVLADSDDNPLEYSGESVGATTANLFKHTYRVSTKAERIMGAVHNIPLTEIDPGMVDQLDPRLTSTSFPPFAWYPAGRDPEGYLLVGFFPPPSAAMGIRVDYIKSEDLATDADTTMYPSVLLKWKTAESAASFLLARTGDIAWASLADRYNKRYNEAYDKAREEDQLRQSPPTAISESSEMPGVGSDEFAIARDVDWSP
jgi:hypothetical protein